MRIIVEGYAYAVENFEDPTGTQLIQFIHKEKIDEQGTLRTVRDGTTNEEILAVLLNRLLVQYGKLPSNETMEAIQHLNHARELLMKRTQDRVKRGVEGTMKE